MSLARAFTTRRAKLALHFGDNNGNNETLPQRSLTVKSSIARNDELKAKISAPLALIHTTNMLSYNAPDIHPQTPASSSSSQASPKTDDGFFSDAHSSPPTSPDTPFPTADKLAPSLASVEPNHLSCYFKTPGSVDAHLNPDETAPAIPKRAPSHRKPAGTVVGRKRSESRLSERSHGSLSSKGSFSFSRASSGSTNTTVSSRSTSAQSTALKEGLPASSSAVTFTAVTIIEPTTSVPIVPAARSTSTQRKRSVRETPTRAPPSGRELAQLAEVIEECSAADLPNMKAAVVDREEQELLAKGLKRFRAEDYLTEIQCLLEDFSMLKPQLAPVWI